MKQDQDAASISGESKSMSMSTDWTDAKHSLYLDSMEVSFVHQLYTNNNFIASSPEKKKEQSKAASSSSSKPFFRQFKVLRDGHWGRIDFERNNNWKRLPEEEEQEDDGAALLLMNPWIRHFRSGRRCQTVADDASISSATAIKGKPEEAPFSRIADNNTEEMTDQNFVDEDNEEMVKAKRVRTWAIAAPRKDKSRTKN